MVKQPLILKECHRREFVIAAGIVVVSGLEACSGSPQKETQQKSLKEIHPLTIPREPITIRVRVAKERVTGSPILLNGKSIHQVPRFLEKTTHVLQCDGHDRRVTAEVHVHSREDVSPTAFDVVAHIPLEAYLPGVLAGELYAHWHPDTFAAQAVAARSYAVVQHLNRKDTSHFDLDDDPSSQVFLGDITLEVAHKAVNQTQDVVLTWNNTIVPSYYSACCGGIAATATDAISSSSQHNIPPLQGHGQEDICTTLGVHAWVADRPSRTFRRRLNAYAVKMNIQPLANLRSIRAIKPRKRNVHGRPTSLTIVDRRKEEIEITAKQLLIAANTSLSSLPAPEPTVWSSFLEGEKKSSTLQLKGVGHGHGVGLCQHGAQALAGTGKTWEEILGWYYPQSSLSTLKG